MAINYALFPNPLTNDPDDHMAIVQEQNSHSIDDLIDMMVGHGTTVTRAEAFSVIEELERAIVNVLSLGGSVNTPLFRIHASIPGVFTDEFDSFDPSRHQVKLNVNPGTRINEIADELEVVKIDAVMRRPVPKLFRDIESGTRNETITPGGVGELKGSLLKLDPQQADQGIFFIASDGTETKVDTYVRNMPSNLIFTIPDSLLAGDYEVEVRTKLQGNSQLREGRLTKTLTVA